MKRKKTQSILDWGKEQNDEFIVITHSAQNRFSDYWGNEDEFKLLQLHKVPPREKLKLAKGILIGGLLYLSLVVFIMLFNNPNEIKSVWEYSSIAIHTTLSVVIGYYFGKD